MTYSACPPTQPPMSTYPYAAPGRAGLTFRQMPVLAFLAVAATAAGDVEGHRTEVAFLDEFDISPRFDDLAGDLVSEHETLRRGGAAAHHVLVAAADIRGDDLQDHAVLAFP